MVEGVLDAVIVTEKAPLIRTHLTQVKGCQRQAPCGWRDREEGEVRGGQKYQNRKKKKNTKAGAQEISMTTLICAHSNPPTTLKR